MSARLATFCLVLATVPVASAQRAASPGGELVVYLRGSSTQPSGPIGYMRGELEAIMQRAGFDITWRAADDPVDASFVAVVDFSGSCAPGAASPLREETSLASTSITDGRVLPFSRIECSALTRAIGPVSEMLYGKAMARVLAHELYHVLAQTTHHGRSGIAKPCFRTADLFAAKFVFEEEIRVQLRSLRGPSATVDTSNEETGRRGVSPRDR